MADPEYVYWDTMTFAHRISERADCISILKTWSDAAERNEVVIVTSAFTLCELGKLDTPGKPILPVDQEKLISRFFMNDFVLVVQVDRRVANLSREIIRLGGIQGKDAVHIASAVVAGVSVLHTYDGAMIKKDQQIGNPPLRIEVPAYRNLQPLLPPISGIP